MGLFGDQDAADVNDNPFFVDDGTYVTFLNEFLLKTKEDSDGEVKRGLTLNWTVEEDDSEYDGSSISEYIPVYLTDEDAPDTKALKRDRARAKKRLTELGFSTDQMNDLISEDGEFNDDLAGEFVGNYYDVSVKNTKSKNFDEDNKVYTNVTKIESRA